MKQRHPVTTWEPGYLEEVESLRPDEGVILHSFGSTSLAVRTPNAFIYIDPYLAGEPVEGIPGMHRCIAVPIDPRCIRVVDAVLITHSHYDHCQEDTLLAIQSATKAVFCGPDSAVSEMTSFGISPERARQVAAGDRFAVGDVEVTVWKGYDPNEASAVLYLLQTQGLRLLFTGDSFGCEAFRKIAESVRVDVAQLSFGREFYMNEEELLESAKVLNPRLLLPCHWELWRGHTGDILHLGRLVERRQPAHDTVILSIGDRLHLKQDGTYAKAP